MCRQEITSILKAYIWGLQRVKVSKEGRNDREGLSGMSVGYLRCINE
jgi:hypothetical protein